MGTSLYTVRVVLHALGVQDFGIYSVAAAVIAVLAFLNGTMSQAAQRFLSIDIGKRDYTSLQKTFNATLIVHLAIAVFVVFAAESLGSWLLNHKLNIPLHRLDSANHVLHFSAAAAAMMIVQTPFNALIIARERMWFFSAVSVIEAILKLGTALIISYSDSDRLVFYAGLVFSSTAITTVLYASFCLRYFPEARFKSHRDRRIYSALFSFTGWSFIGSLSSACRNQGSNILLNLFFGAAANASHLVMSQAQTAATSFMNSFQMALSPQIYQSYASQDMHRMYSLIFMGAKLNFALLIVIIAPTIYCMDYVLDAWLGTPPENAGTFIRLALIMLLSEAVSQPLMTAAAATGKIKWYQIIVGGTVLLNLPLSYLAYINHARQESFLYIAIFITAVTLAQRVIFLRFMIGLQSIAFAREVLLPILVTSTVVAGLLFSVGKLEIKPNSILELLFFYCAIGMATLIICICFTVSHRERLHFIRLAIDRFK
ncbi:MATE family efflux transporter [Stenotrophomonas sp. CFBP 13718]|uniref:lipopolysaccharide biosynthesis protein n=1 Tax=Stenotrophomonas sp. CFBP 13718 TaxID=2775304 RepID=UPI0017836F3C|nr:MATE family efflux transporter [Stenotrophomonas sp. CFBP 13718]MBD8696064.1 lipopolysaccharide biosynthesis protein [Stenotrophomonas sp. CFBP 13718]